jgi:pyruvate dehydrogenase E1 component alpha subunit
MPLSIEKETILKIYRNMVRTRFLDDKIDEMIASGISITQHSTRGQEATTNAACAALEANDYVMPYHRGWGWAIGKGMEPKILLAELLGKKTGGVGLSIKCRKTNEVVLCFIGDGASNEGNVHEGMNLAAVWKAPVVFICENNLYAVFTPGIEVIAVRDIADRAQGYGIPGIIVDGNDAVAVYEVAREAVDRARKGEGPTLIESKTYRLSGHTAMDQFHLGGYRKKEEVEDWAKKDPIKRLREKLIEMKISSDADLNTIDEKARQEMEEAERFAKESPFPTREEIFQDVYVE